MTAYTISKLVKMIIMLMNDDSHYIVVFELMALDKTMF